MILNILSTLHDIVKHTLVIYSRKQVLSSENALLDVRDYVIFTLNLT